MNMFNCLAAASYDFTVEFPRLGIEGDNAIKVSRTAFHIGGMYVRWYGIIIAFGMLLCFILGMKACEKEGFSKDDLVDYLIAAIPSAIIGARLYYVVFNFQDYKENLAEIFYIWHGGLAIYGGVIFAFIAVFIMSRVKKHKFFMLTDFAAPYLLLGQGIGRWGNFFNQEAYGGYTSLPWGMTSETIKNDPYILNQIKQLNQQVIPTAHPTFLYESILCLIGFAFILIYRAKVRKIKGECTCLYMIYYGIARFFIEGLRTDSLYIGNTGIRVSQVVSAALVVIGIALFIDLRRKYSASKKEKENAEEPSVGSSSFAGVVAKVAEMDKAEEEIEKINENIQGSEKIDEDSSENTEIKDN